MKQLIVPSFYVLLQDKTIKAIAEKSIAISLKTISSAQKLEIIIANIVRVDNKEA